MGTRTAGGGVPSEQGVLEEGAKNVQNGIVFVSKLGSGGPDTL